MKGHHRHSAVERNTHGLTFAEWHEKACDGGKPEASLRELTASWLRGEDPATWALFSPSQQLSKMCGVTALHIALREMSEGES